MWAGFTLKQVLLYLKACVVHVRIYIYIFYIYIYIYIFFLWYFFSLKTQLWWKAAGKILLHAVLYVSNLIWSCWRNIEEDVTGAFRHSSCQISDIEVTLKKHVYTFDDTNFNLIWIPEINYMPSILCVWYFLFARLL